MGAIFWQREAIRVLLDTTYELAYSSLKVFERSIRVDTWGGCKCVR